MNHSLKLISFIFSKLNNYVYFLRNNNTKCQYFNIIELLIDRVLTADEQCID